MKKENYITTIKLVHYSEGITTEIRSFDVGTFDDIEISLSRHEYSIMSDWSGLKRSFLLDFSLYLVLTE